MSGFILIFFDDSTELAGDILPAGKQTRTETSRPVRVAPLPQSVNAAEVSPKVLKTAADYRPNCQNKDACGASGLTHCYSCQKLIAAEVG